jgi:hypothetical protein
MNFNGDVAGQAKEAAIPVGSSGNIEGSPGHSTCVVAMSNSLKACS